MPSPFSLTLRSLEADGRSRRLWVFVPAVLFLAIWLSWFFRGEVSVYEVTAEARLEVAGEAQAIQAPLDGRIAARVWQLGQEVRAGDVLVELEVASERLEMAEELARLSAVEGELSALASQVAGERRALLERRRATAAALAEAEARVAEAAAVADLADREASRQERLAQQGLLSAAESERFRSQATQHRAAWQAATLARDRQAREQASLEAEGAAKVSALARQHAELSGKKASGALVGERLAHEIERRTVRAPLDGTVAEVASLFVGAVVEEGDRLGAILPKGPLKVVADFSSEAALGRVRPGQSATLRLSGYPSAQYGALAATVERVGSEPRQGKVRVELVAHPSATSPLPFVHGLPGVLAVEVERVSPWALVLGTVGKLLDRPATRSP